MRALFAVNFGHVPCYKQRRHNGETKYQPYGISSWTGRRQHSRMPYGYLSVRNDRIVTTSVIQDNYPHSMPIQEAFEKRTPMY